MCEICREQRRIVENTRWYQWVWEIIKLLAAITILIFGTAWLCHAVGMVGTEEGAWPGPPPTTTSQPADHCGGQND